MTAIMAYITCEDEAQARKIGETLVQERLVACVNILPGMRSMYWWDGEVQSAEEVVLIAKTTEAHAKALTNRVKELHPYEVPCVVTLPIVGGNPDFLHWIKEETARN